MSVDDTDSDQRIPTRPGPRYLEQAGSPAVSSSRISATIHRPDDRLGVKKRQQA